MVAMAALDRPYPKPLAIRIHSKIVTLSENKYPVLAAKDKQTPKIKIPLTWNRSSKRPEIRRVNNDAKVKIPVTKPT